MFRKELIVLGGLSLAVFVLVAGVASLVVRAVQRDASLVVEDTLPGLVSAGEAIDRLNENWFNTYRIIGVESADERVRLINSVETNSTSELWHRYRESIYDVRDAQLFQFMASNRAHFLSARSNYFALVRAGQIVEAQNYFRETLEGVAKNYHRAAGDIFVFNAAIGEQRADRIIRLSRWTPYVLGGLCVVIFVIGVFIGFKASLGAFSRAVSDYTQLKK